MSNINCELLIYANILFFKDIEYIYDVFCMLLFYITPVFYKVSNLKLAGEVSWFGFVLKLNPLYWVTDLFRSCVLVNGFDWNWNGFSASPAIGTL